MESFRIDDVLDIRGIYRFEFGSIGRCRQPDSAFEPRGARKLGGADKEFYYSFAADPGKVTVTVDIKASEGVRI